MCLLLLPPPLAVHLNEEIDAQERTWSLNEKPLAIKKPRSKVRTEDELGSGNFLLGDCVEKAGARKRFSTTKLFSLFISKTTL